MDRRNVGGLAEDVFAAWCKAHGMTANKSGDDRKGWDYIVQFGHVDHSAVNSPLDTRPPELTCLIQVKGTDRRTNRWPVKLSNWQHLIQSPLPTFFLVLEFDPQIDPQQPQRGYLIHVDNAWITTILKYLRKLHPNTELHRKKLALGWSQANRLGELNGECIRETLRHHVGADFHAYTMKKLKWIETVGYNNRRYRGTVQMAADSEDELMTRLVDFAIGLRDKIPVTGLALSENRFDIPVTLQEEEFEYAELSMQRKPDKLLDLRLRDGQSRQAVILKQAQVYNPTSVFPFLKEHHVKIRIVADFVQLLVHYSQRKIDINVQTSILDTPQTVRRLDVFQRLIEVLSEGSRNGLVLEAFDTRSWPVFLGRMESGFNLPPDIEHYAPIGDFVWLCQQFGIDPDTVVAPEQLITQHNKFGRFRAVLERSATVVFSFETALLDEDRNLGPDTLIWSVIRDFIDVGGWRVYLYARLRGEEVEIVEVDEQWGRIKPRRIIVEDYEFRVIHQSEIDSWDDSHIFESLRRPLET